MKIRVCQTSDVAENDMRAFEVDGQPVLIANIGGEYYAIGDTCSHAEASLSEGLLNGEELTVECPLHGAIFDLKTGEALEFPADEPVAAYKVVIDGDDVFLETEGD